MSTLEEVNRNPARVQDELLALGDNDFADKYRLQTLRDDLRSRAAAFRVDYDLERSDEALLQELAARRAQVDAIHKNTMDYVTQAGAGSSGGSTYDHGGKSGINHDIADAQGIGEINARISRLETILDERGIEYPAE